MRHIRKGDEVVVIAGKDKGRKGTVRQVLPGKNRVIVDNVNIVKRHTKPGQGNRAGGIIEKEAPIHISNVMPVDPKTGDGTRVRTKKKDNKRVRVTVKSETELSQ